MEREAVNANVEVAEVAKTLASIHTESGASLHDLASASPVLLIFLRHFGCSFCRQTISDVADLRGELDGRGGPASVRAYGDA